MATRTLYVRMQLSTDLPDHDAFSTDPAGLSYAAVWIERLMGRSTTTDVEVTVYDNPQDMVLDLEEGL